MTLSALLLLFGCTPHKAPNVSIQHSSAWQEIEPGSADLAWKNHNTTMYLKSFCDERYDDRPLDALADSLTMGISQTEPISSESVVIDGRAALIRRQQGTLDGVSVLLGVTVIKKHNCVYDLVLLQPTSSPLNNDLWDDYLQMAHSFQVRR